MSPKERYDLYANMCFSTRTETAVLPQLASLQWQARNKWREVALVSWIRGLIKIDELLKKKAKEASVSINEMLAIDGALMQALDANKHDEGAASKRPRLP